MNLLENIRGRIGAVIGSVLFGLCLLVMGAFLAFYVSPQQAIEWRHIQNLPELDAAGIAAAATGAEIAVTGYLQGNETLTPEGFVAYEQHRWVITEDNEGELEGDWELVQQLIPPLTVAISGGTVRTVPVSDAILSGVLHEVVTPGNGSRSVTYEGQSLPEGSTRTQGFFDGDLITVVGQKGTSGDLVPQRLFGGDRVQLVTEIRQGARVAFAVGVGMMICSPIAAVLGILGALFGRRKQKL